MALDDHKADIIHFECEHCNEESSPVGIRRSDGICTNCRERSWMLVTQYHEGEQALGLAPLIFQFLFGIRVLHRVRETIRIVTSQVSAEEAVALSKAGMFRIRSMAYRYMDARRKLDGLKERQEMRGQGGQNCRACGSLFMPSPDKLWTTIGCCSKVCAAKYSASTAVEFESEKPAELETKSPAVNINISCPCGNKFSVSALYRGTIRACPSCGQKISVS